MIQDLYKIEREACEQELSFDLIKELRQREAIPVLDKFENWLIGQSIKVLPKSTIGIDNQLVIRMSSNSIWFIILK